MPQTLTGPDASGIARGSAQAPGQSRAGGGGDGFRSDPVGGNVKGEQALSAIQVADGVPAQIGADVLRHVRHRSADVEAFDLLARVILGRGEGLIGLRHEQPEELIRPSEREFMELGGLEHDPQQCWGEVARAVHMGSDERVVGGHRREMQAEVRELFRGAGEKGMRG